ncbi:hypothetical protein [Pseudidiomarina marina]|uniref:Uncharacterized protein n=1 Tax=Pseudidiomarina marina TaxID=502366 RepID=A0A432YCD0_9GAMM|nr:hypothetical protein [Pseudidiomarina marina]RUO58665.1 hypothetical protein CWI76_11110 [Pseudidiomarina marina]
MKSLKSNTPLENLIKRVADILYNCNFPEEYDFVYDSILESKERRQGTNPMHRDYIEIVQRRRLQLGVTPLGSNGKPTDLSSNEKALQWAIEHFEELEPLFEKELAQVLFEIDPANTCCKENGCEDEYALLAKRIRSEMQINNSSIRDVLNDSFGDQVIDEVTMTEVDQKIINVLALRFAEIIDFRIKKNLSPNAKSTDMILAEMEKLRSIRPSTINGARGASIYYKDLHDELDRRSYTGKRPSRQYTHPSMKG